MHAHIVSSAALSRLGDVAGIGASNDCARAVHALVDVRCDPSTRFWLLLVVVFVLLCPADHVVAVAPAQVILCTVPLGRRGEEEREADGKEDGADDGLHGCYREGLCCSRDKLAMPRSLTWRNWMLRVVGLD